MTRIACFYAIFYYDMTDYSIYLQGVLVNGGGGQKRQVYRKIYGPMQIRHPA